MTSSRSFTTSKISSLIQNARQLRELLETHALRASLQRNLQFRKCAFHRCCRPILFQELEHHFPALRKAALNDGRKHSDLLPRNQRPLAPRECHAPGIHVRLREKASCRNFEPASRLIPDLDEQREHAVIRIAHPGREPPHHLKLQSSHQSLR